MDTKKLIIRNWHCEHVSMLILGFSPNMPDEVAHTRNPVQIKHANMVSKHAHTSLNELQLWRG